MASGTFAWVCICILNGGYFSFTDANADPRTTGLAPNTMNGVLGIAISLLLSVGLSWAYEL
jgi:hypothetical protein